MLGAGNFLFFFLEICSTNRSISFQQPRHSGSEKFSNPVIEASRPRVVGVHSLTGEERGVLLLLRLSVQQKNLTGVVACSILILMVFVFLGDRELLVYSGEEEWSGCQFIERT